MFNFPIDPENWDKIIESMAEGLMLIDPAGKILFANKALEKLLLYDKNELIGKTCDVLQCDSCFGTKKGGEGKYCGLFLKGEVRNLKCTFLRKDGKKVSVLKNATVLKDKGNRVVMGVENLTDLSNLEQKNRVITVLKRQLHLQNGFEGMLGKSPAMQKIYDLTKSAAQSDVPIIIYGESGTGKELVASALHNLGTRQQGPYIKVNCAALNENLLESELFGHTKGAFTGADTSRIGRFEAANGGDIFLDEIGDMSYSLQTKLLRVLQEREIERVGDHQPIPINVRIISATNKNLLKLIKAERFREDLYYRIGVIPIHLPPLRERKEDIPLLVETFIEQTQLRTEKNIYGASKETLEHLFTYDWPGNIRELINVIDYAFVLCHGVEILPQHLPPHLINQLKNAIQTQRQTESTIILEGERQQLINALKSSGGNKSKAARMLGISRVTLWKKLKKHTI